ncbi:hypothetical protein RSOLAG22IIIB_10756 [Rhizoctonia solani]|uniref:Uncharacterized protein n=1 Tax=Rhizoctonia solani TaxID=456999 RepID=A0A0K6G567_9AGAM|nr:hypothetical protein RSOLAG22IIIB_10756 [Rhizoctonia solani]
MNSIDDQGQGVAQLPASDSYGSLADCFRTKYLGGTAQCFLNTTNYYTDIKRNKGDTKLYNRSISVLQSSGMGKSRMVDEIAESAFTIPANIREKLKEGEKAYPPPDDSLRKYLVNPVLDVRSDAYEQANHAAIVMALCDATKTRVDTHFKNLEGSEQASAWAQYLKTGGTDKEVGPNRQGFYEEAVGNATEYISNRCRGSTNPKGFPTEKEFDAIVADLKKSAKNMLSCVAPKRSKTTNACYFYFDEAHALTKPPTTESLRSRSSYRNLGKVLSKINALPIFFVFLSTNSNLQRFAPVTHDYTSLRGTEGSFLIPPFVELPFDIFLPDVYKALKHFGKTRSLANACTTEVMSGMGRPL